MRVRIDLALMAISALVVAAPSGARAQEPRLVTRLPAAARMQVDSVLEAARADGLPTEPLVDRALEGAAKGASPDVIVSAVIRLRRELGVARGAFGESASAAELTAGASALRAGATHADLSRLRALRGGQPLTIAASVLADLVAVGVPADTAIAAVLALAPRAADADYVTFRRDVGRDIALGASPTAALGVRMQSVDKLASDAAHGPTGAGTTSGPRKRKP